MIDSILNKALTLQEISMEEAMILYNQASLPELMNTADRIRHLINPSGNVTWQIDRNVNYTNVCSSGCLFCNFHCKPNEPEKSYDCSLEQYEQKIKELKAVCDAESKVDGKDFGYQLLLQGGLHPKYGIEYYETLFRNLKSIEPSLKLNALGPPEIAHISRISKLTYRQTLERLIAAGLDTFPGAGAEILCDRVRKIISPAKPSATEWLAVMEEAHKLGLSTTATMVYGSIETPEERIGHLFTLRETQNKKAEGAIGFRSFIPWPMQLKGTELENKISDFALRAINTGPAEYLRIIALSRIILLNIPHIQASWLTTGVTTAQIALNAGADDMGSIMIEENVVSSAGSHNSLDAAAMKSAIREAGFNPMRRDQNYRID